MNDATQENELLFSKIQHPKKLAFLAALATTGNKSAAARAARIDRSTYWHWERATGPDGDMFREAVADAMDAAAASLETEARRRALDGDWEPVINEGLPVFCSIIDTEHSSPISVGGRSYAVYERERLLPWMDHSASGIAPYVAIVPNGTEGAVIVPVLKSRKSDTLLIFTLKGAMPEKYTERQKIEHSGGMKHEHSGDLERRRVAVTSALATELARRGIHQNGGGQPGHN